VELSDSRSIHCCIGQCSVFDERLKLFGVDGSRYRLCVLRFDVWAFAISNGFYQQLPQRLALEGAIADAVGREDRRGDGSGGGQRQREQAHHHAPSLPLP
jgi:hypothetical protein